MIEITSLKLGKIEELNRVSGQPSENKIVLKKKYDDKDFFSVASLLQFVYSWVRRHSEVQIILPFTLSELEEMDSNDLRHFVADEINYLAIISGWPQIITKDGDDVMFLIQEHTRKIRAILNSPAPVDWRAQKGNAMLLPCFDQYANGGGHVNSFYYAPNKMYSLAEFVLVSPFAHRLSYFLKSFNFQLGVRTFKDVLDDLNRIVYELISNTDQWARTDGNNTVLNPNARGVYLKVHKAPPQSFQKEYKHYPAVSAFFNPDDFTLNANGEMYALEISVFDSGPGYVRRYLGTNVIEQTTAENVQIIKHCLCRHKTSARGDARIVKGNGLDKVMELLSGKGFFRIRSQDCSVYRDMKAHVYKEFSNSNDIDVFDWETGSNTHFTTMPIVEGAIFSIIYPLS